jgi:hypothetical protein
VKAHIPRGGSIVGLERIAQLIGKYRLTAPAQDGIALRFDIAVLSALDAIGFDEDRQILRSAGRLGRQQCLLHLELEPKRRITLLRRCFLSVRSSADQQDKQGGPHYTTQTHRGLLVWFGDKIA